MLISKIWEEIVMIKVDDKIKEHLIDLNPGEENISLTIFDADSRE